MIDVKKQKVNEVVQGMHEAITRKAEQGKQNSNNDMVLESRLFAVICHNYEVEPTKCAHILNDTYGYTLSGNEIIHIFRNRRMSNPVERKALFQWAGEVADLFGQAILGKKESFEQYEKRREEFLLPNGRKHDSQKKIAAIMIYEKFPEIAMSGDIEGLHSFGKAFGKNFFDEISEILRDVYGFPQTRDNKKKKQTLKVEMQMTYEQAMRRIERLENTLDRTNIMLQDLQDEFAEELEASKAKELADFFAKLNSEKYGYILDELLVVQKGVKELRKSNYELPIEINGLLIMVKKLTQFVKDCHIDPIMKVNSVKEVVASDVEFCNYEGTPFTSPNETKNVRVVSPGWIYKDKEIQISRPKVKEEE